MPDDDLDPMSAAIAKAMDNFEASAPQPPEEVSEEAPAEQQATDAEPADDTSTREAAVTAEEAGVEDSADDAPPVSEETPPAPAFEVPQHWSAERRAKFERIPAEMQQEWFDEWKSIEGGYTKKFQDLAAQRKPIEQLTGALRPLEARLSAEGLSLEDGLRRVAGMMEYGFTDSAGAITQFVDMFGRSVAGTEQARNLVRQIAQKVGVDLGAPQAQSDEEDYLDPRAKQEISALRGQLSELQKAQQTFAQQQYTAAVNGAQSQLEAFASATDTDGNQKYPHFEALRGQMSQLYQAGLASSLEQAYEMALWSSSDLRSQILEQERAKVASAQEAARKQAEEKRKAELARAKTASAGPKSRSEPTTAAHAPAETMEQTLARYVDKTLAEHAA